MERAELLNEECNAASRLLAGALVRTANCAGTGDLKMVLDGLVVPVLLAMIDEHYEAPQSWKDYIASLRRD